MMVTYAFASDEQLQLELYGQVSAREYVAVGFSKDDRMVKMSFRDQIELIFEEIFMLGQ
jgi:superfamily II DNA/RNA helicase